jgi:hypothetical protein
MKEIGICDRVGSFAENKDLAREIRENDIKPTLNCGEEVVLDFKGVSMATQSFIHAMISDPIRLYGAEVLDRIAFKNCNSAIETLVKVVCDYMQDSFGSDK